MSIDKMTAVQVVTANMVTISLFARISGLTEKAINDKIDKGVWAAGREWHRAPDGRRYVDIKGYELWVRSGSARGRFSGRLSNPTAATLVDLPPLLPWVRLSLYCLHSGDTPDAVSKRLRSGHWLREIHARRPEGSAELWINLEAVNAWAAGCKPAHRHGAER